MLIRTVMQAEIRKCDEWGCGHYKATRGNREHNGIDLLCKPGSEPLSLCDGVVTKFGYPYSNDLSYRYVQITTEDDLNYRYFYVKPNKLLTVGDEIHTGTSLGTVQDLGKRYPGIPNHLHFEVVKYDNGKKEYIDPAPFLDEVS